MLRTNFVQSILGGFVMQGHKRFLWDNAKSGRKRILLPETPLAGYQYHRADGVWPFLRVGEKLRLQRERNNRYDPNAIAVYFKNDRLGYIPRSENRALARMMDYGERLEARITLLLVEPNPWRRIRFEVFINNDA